jgi:hypothetical protein
LQTTVLVETLTGIRRGEDPAGNIYNQIEYTPELSTKSHQVAPNRTKSHQLSHQHKLSTKSHQIAPATASAQTINKGIAYK